MAARLSKRFGYSEGAQAIIPHLLTDWRSLHQAARGCGGAGAEQEHCVSRGSAADIRAGFDARDLEAEVAGGGGAFRFLRGPLIKRRGRLFGPDGIEDAVEHGGVSPWREVRSCH
jgi:hypothetical protein